MKEIFFIDGDFKTGMGGCKFHCSPTCHPGQIGPEWHYGCTYKAWPQNKYGDFVPFVECNGSISKCELRGKIYKKFIGRFRQGKSNSLNHTKAKVKRLEDEINELNKLIGL
jgi:hypothetical protein